MIFFGRLSAEMKEDYVFFSKWRKSSRPSYLDLNMDELTVHFTSLKEALGREVPLGSRDVIRHVFCWSDKRFDVYSYSSEILGVISASGYFDLADRLMLSTSRSVTQELLDRARSANTGSDLFSYTAYHEMFPQLNDELKAIYRALSIQTAVQLEREFRRHGKAITYRKSIVTNPKVVDDIRGWDFLKIAPNDLCETIETIEDVEARLRYHLRLTNVDWSEITITEKKTLIINDDEKSLLEVFVDDRLPLNLLIERSAGFLIADILRALTDWNDAGLIAFEGMPEQTSSVETLPVPTTPPPTWDMSELDNIDGVEVPRPITEPLDESTIFRATEETDTELLPLITSGDSNLSSTRVALLAQVHDSLQKELCEVEHNLELETKTYNDEKKAFTDTHFLKEITHLEETADKTDDEAEITPATTEFDESLKGLQSSANGSFLVVEEKEEVRHKINTARKQVLDLLLTELELVRHSPVYNQLTSLVNRKIRGISNVENVAISTLPSETVSEVELTDEPHTDSS